MQLRQDLLAPERRFFVDAREIVNSMLELRAAARGLTPAFSCRSGSCGTCKVKVLAGAVAYPNSPNFPVAEGEALRCYAVPADGPGHV